MRKLVMILMCAVLVMTAQAQTSDPVQQRVDQAMTHLTDWLELSTPINRQTHFWRWEERVYADSSFDCGIPGRTYAAQPNRALNITITYEDVDYDYRVSWDGAILVLCAADGIPLYRSDAPDYRRDVETVPADVPDVAFYTWVYMQVQQRLYLLSEEGEVAGIDRPIAPNEDPMGDKRMAISRDGRYLVQAVTLTTGAQALTIYDFQTESFSVVSAGPDETIFLGPSFDPGPPFALTGSPLIFNEANTAVAVGFARADDPAVNNWRVAIIDLRSGAILSQLTYLDLSFILSDSDQELIDAASGSSGGSYRAVPVYYDEDGIHVRLILQFTGGASEYPTFEWLPDLNAARPSPYTHIDTDILPGSGRALFPVYDPNVTAPDVVGMGPPNNAIVAADYQGTGEEAYVFAGTTQEIRNPRWGDGGDLLIYDTPTGDDAIDSVVQQIGGDAQYTLPDYAVGAPGGVLTVIEGAATPQVAFYLDAETFLRVWNAPPQNGRPIFVWVQPEGVPLGVSSVGGGQASAPEPTPLIATTDCGERPSIVQVGITARSTIDDGSPLNIRNEPNVSTSQVSRIIPENTRFQIIGGPECADGYTWWQIQLDDGFIGWVAEAGTDFYFIEPAP